MLTSIDVKFIFDSARLGCSAPQIYSNSGMLRQGSPHNLHNLGKEMKEQQIFLGISVFLMAWIL